MSQLEEAEEDVLVLEGIEQEERVSEKRVPSIPRAAFLKFCKKNGISEEKWNLHSRYPSFTVPTFIKVKERFGSSRINWWWHNGPFLFFLNHLRDGRLKLVLEIGPLHGEQRVALIEEMETVGVTFKAALKLRTAKYTRLYSNTKVVNDWEDEEQVSEAMTELFKHSKHLELL